MRPFSSPCTWVDLVRCCLCPLRSSPFHTPPSILPIFLLPPDVLPSRAHSVCLDFSQPWPVAPSPALPFSPPGELTPPPGSVRGGGGGIAAIHHATEPIKPLRQSRKFQEHCCFCFREREDGCFQGLRGCSLTPALCTNTPALSHP